MDTLQYNLNDYILYVFASHNKRLLVEGEDDYRLFSRIVDTLDIEDGQIEVDDASCLIDFGPRIGNREKVELVCSAIRNESFSNKFVGFSDREFREFSFEPDLRDKIQNHKVDGRLVWTRGHSIENYYFEFEIVCNPISTLSTTRYYRAALILFEKNFEQIIRIACIVSLIGLEISKFSALKKSISWNVFSVTDDQIALNLDAFEEVIVDRKIVPKNIFKTRYSYWEKIINRADIDVVQWICHGHVGLTLIWESYKSLVFELSKNDGNPHREVSRTLCAREGVQFNACATTWIEKSRDNGNNFPFEVLRLLEIEE